MYQYRCDHSASDLFFSCRIAKLHLFVCWLMLFLKVHATLLVHFDSYGWQNDPLLYQTLKAATYALIILSFVRKTVANSSKLYIIVSYRVINLHLGSINEEHFQSNKPLLIQANYQIIFIMIPKAFITMTFSFPQ